MELMMLIVKVLIIGWFFGLAAWLTTWATNASPSIIWGVSAVGASAVSSFFVVEWAVRTGYVKGGPRMAWLGLADADEADQ